MLDSLKHLVAAGLLAAAACATGGPDGSDELSAPDDRPTLTTPELTQSAAQESCGPGLFTLSGEAGPEGPAGESGGMGPSGPQLSLVVGGGLWGDGSDGAPLSVDVARVARRRDGPWWFEAERSAAAEHQRSDATSSNGAAVLVPQSFAPIDPELTAWALSAADLGEPLGRLTARVSVRLRVTSTASGSTVGQLRCQARRASGGGFVDVGPVLPLVPNQFPGNLVWSRRVLDCAFAVDDLEQRLVVNTFTQGVTDLWLDSVLVSPGVANADASFTAHVSSGTGKAFCAAFEAVCVTAAVRVLAGYAVNPTTCLGSYAVMYDCNRDLAPGVLTTTCPTVGGTCCQNSYSSGQAPLVTCARLRGVIP